MKNSIAALSALLLMTGLYPTAQAQIEPDTYRPMLNARGQEYERASDIWSGMWIEVPNVDPHAYSVCLFRKDITLTTVPERFRIRITGDNRYKLYVNGTLVSVGPARSDLWHWKAALVDLAPYLHAGRNVVAAQVCNYGKETPCAIFSVATGLLIDGEEEAAVLNTDESWLCAEDASYASLPVAIPTFYVAGPGERVDMHKAKSHWLEPDYDLSDWQPAHPFDLATPHDTDLPSGNYIRLLVDNNLPEMERIDERLQTVRRCEGNARLSLPKGWPAQSAALTIPAHSDVTLLLDQQHLTNAYLNLHWSQGRNAQLTTTYAEALYTDTLTMTKANRNDVEGMLVAGRRDHLTSNGEKDQHYQSLEWRTFRYVELHIQTADETLVLEDLYGTRTGYPFSLKAHLDTDDAELQQMLEVGWRTQRLCAYETYMDCPYYEQLQYLGDTRIQALITLYNTGDDTMVRNFLTQADQSRNAEGCAQGRYPTVVSQYITPYALSYVYALHDYLMYGRDEQFLQQLLPGAEAIMNYFGHYQQADGRLRNLPGWNFSDWVDNHDGWNMGIARKGPDHCSALMDLQLLLGLQMMADLERHFGYAERAKTYDQQAEHLRQGIDQAYWDAERGLYADASDHRVFSQHTGSLALLCGMKQGDEAREMGRKLLSDDTLAPCSVYYKYYLHEALIKAGLGEDYLQWLDIWRENLAYGLTTWAETSDIVGTRSDCHAWGASPNIELYRTVLGIDSDAPGFAQVRIEPHLTGLKADKKGVRKLAGSVPTPHGEVRADYKLDKHGHLTAQITLPQGVNGSLVWHGQHHALHEGVNELALK